MIKRKFKNGVAKDSILLTVVKFVTMGLGILITMMLSKKFSLTDYGTYSQAILVISVVTSFTILGLTDGANFFYNSTDDDSKKQDYVSTVFLIQCIFGTVGAILILIFQNQISIYFGNTNLKYIYIYIAFSPLLNNLLSVYQVLFISIGKAKIIATRNLYISVAKLAIVAIACLITESVVTIFALLLVVDILQLVYFWRSFNKNAFFINLKKSKLSLVVPILSYCVPLAVYILMNSLTVDMGKILIGRMTNTETLAIYTNCSKVLPFDILTTAFATVLIPYITRFVASEQNDKGQHLYYNYLRFAYTTTWIVAFGAIVTAPELIQFLYGEKYVQGLGIFITYIIVSMIRFANVSIILRAKGKSKALMIYSITTLAANFVLNIIFYNLFGIIGPAVATLLITIAINMLMLLQGAKILGTSLHKIIYYKDVLVLILELIAAGGVAFGIRCLLNSYSLNSFLVLCVSYGVYGLIMGLMNYKKVWLMLREMNTIKM